MFSKIELLADFGLHVLLVLGNGFSDLVFFEHFLPCCCFPLEEPSRHETKARSRFGNFWGIVVTDDFGMGLLDGSGNRFRTDLGNGFVGMALEVVLAVALCRFDGQRSP